MGDSSLISRWQTWVPDSSPALMFIAADWHFNFNIVFSAPGAGACCVNIQGLTAAPQDNNGGTWACGYVKAMAAGDGLTSHDSGDFWGPGKGLLIRGHSHQA